MALPTQPYKGARDFYPEDKRLQKYIFGKLRASVERFGYEEYDAPILEPLDLYLAKTGDEIVNEQTYSFEDRGGRQVAIRPEMTPTVSRMVAAKRQELAYPLRWYSIPNLWRYERPQRGRLREHWQLNVDIFGVETIDADIEILQVVDAVMKDLGAKADTYKIRLNHRGLTDFLLREYIGFDDVQTHTVGKLIDKLAKIGRDEFSVQVDAISTPTQREHGVVEKLLNILSLNAIDDLPEAVRNNASVQSIATALQAADDAGISNITFDPTLMRGFDYYTGLVFEVFDTHPDNNRSLFGGGRYDGLVGLFGVQPVATVGFGMGDVSLSNFLETHNLLPQLRPETQLYVALANLAPHQISKQIAELRSHGANVAVDISGRSLDKQLRTADKKQLRYVLVIGQQEIDSGEYRLRDLTSGEEQTHGLDRIATIVQDRRNTDDRD